MSNADLSSAADSAGLQAPALASAPPRLPTERAAPTRAGANGDATPLAATRQRLLETAIEVFATKGFAEASTREICRLAGVNLAAIHYHFHDKASLYREVFRIPEQVMHLPQEVSDPDATLAQALTAFYAHLMSFVDAPEQARHLRLLFLREQVQPSGVLDSRPGILRNYHEQLLRLLSRRLEVPAADLELHQLALGLVGVGFLLILERNAIREIAPAMLETPAAMHGTVVRLVHLGSAMVAAERQRRTGGESS